MQQAIYLRQSCLWSATALILRMNENWEIGKRFMKVQWNEASGLTIEIILLWDKSYMWSYSVSHIARENSVI